MNLQKTIPSRPSPKFLKLISLTKSYWLICFTLVACGATSQSAASTNQTLPLQVVPSTSTPTSNSRTTLGDRKGYVNVITVKLTETSKNRLCRIDITYPQLQGITNSTINATINAYLKEQFLQSQLDYLQPFDVEQCAKKIQAEYEGKNSYSESGRYVVGLNRDNILSLRYDGRLGILRQAAHPTKMEKAFTINLNTGKVYTYEDLFKSSSNYQEKINQLIAKKLAELPEGSNLVGSFERNQKAQYSFFIDNSSLVILNIFDNFALQSVTVSIQPSEIADIIAPESPLQALLN